MDQIRNTQTLTKFLRSKDGDIESILMVIDQLLNHKYSFHLPNEKMFIFDLICDRLNEYTKWKLNHRIWQLFHDLWIDLGKEDRDRVSRGKSFRKLKLVDILTTIFSQFYDGKDVFSPLYDVIVKVSDQFIIEADYTTCINFLISFQNIFELELNQILMLNWCKMATTIFKSYLNTSNFTPSPKHLGKFQSECLPKVLQTVANLDDDLNECKDIMINIIIDSIFNDGRITINIEQLIASKSLSVPSALLLYQLIVKQLGVKNIEVCEAQFLLILQHYPAVSQALMDILMELNRPLSTKFFNSLYEKSVKAQEWSMISKIFGLDVNLAVSMTPKLLPMNSGSKTLVPVIIKSHIRAREFYEFITDIWSNNLDDPIWCDANVIEIISDSVDDLSTKQLIDILSSKQQKLPVMKALIKGLSNCSQSKIDALESYFQDDLEPDSVFNQSWELKYYLLVLYPSIEFRDRVSDYNDIHCYFYRFRQAELRVLDEPIDGLFHKFLKFLNSNYTPEIIKLLLNRWCVLIEENCSKSAKSIIPYYLKLEYDYLEQFLQETTILFELKNTVGILLNELIADVNNSRLELITYFPIQCIDRYIRYKTIDALTDKPSDINYKIIHHLVPSYKSQIESDGTKLIAFTNPQNCHIFKKIWQHSSTSPKFVGNILHHLSHCKFNTNESLLVDIILKSQSTDELYLELRQKYLKHLSKALNKATDQTSVINYLGSIVSIGGEIDISLIRKLGEMNCREINELLFKLITDKPNNSVQAVTHILAIYLSLKDYNLNSELTNFLTSLDTETYLNVFQYTIVSIEHDISDDNSFQLMQLIVCFLGSIQAQFNDVQIQNWILTKIISTVLSNISYFKDFVQLLKSLKTQLLKANQYSIELIIDLTNKIIESDIKEKNLYEETYILSTQVISHILLYQRFRLTSRHHIIIAILSSCFEPLTLNGRLSDSIKSSMAFSRLLTNLCEPSSSTNKIINLTTNSSILKKHLRNYLPALLVNYISINLKSNFAKPINDELLFGIYSIFDVLSQKELELTNNFLDNQGKVFFKSLCYDYKVHGKWHDT